MEATKASVVDIGINLQRFGVVDYILFAFMLFICMLIGIYFGFCSGKVTATDYLMGGRKMQTIPVAMSLIASFISGITLLGTPTEIYVYGIQYVYIIGGVAIMGLVMSYLYLPVFHDLQLTSTYEYLERRFNKNVRLFGSLLFSIALITWMPIVIYVPALAFNQVTGINVHIITPAVCLVCIFYTCVGGLKAVVWTDVVQTVIMFGAMILVIVKGTLDVGGFGVVWERNYNSGRLEPPNWDINPQTRHTIWVLVIGGLMLWLQSNAVNQNQVQRYLSLPSLHSARILSLDPTIRHSLLTVMLGGGFFWIQTNCVNQNMIQRYLTLPTMHAARIFDPNPTIRHSLWTLNVGAFVYWLGLNAVRQEMCQRYFSLPTLQNARMALFTFIIGALGLVLLCSYSGMLIFATYYDCDPLTTKLAVAKDQLLPLLVMDTLGEFPGLPGLFVAGVFSAALSSLSTGLNSMAAVIFEDFYKSFSKTELSPKATKLLMKTVVVVVGTICVALVFVVEKLGAVLQMSMSLSGITNGPSLGIFSMGLFLPWVTSKGAIAGGVAGLGFMSWICLGTQAAIASGSIRFEQKPVSVEGCTYDFVAPSINSTSVTQPSDVFVLYRMSYLWYTLLGTVVSMSVAVVVSLITGPNDPETIDPILLSPGIRRYFHKKKQPQDVDIALLNGYKMTVLVAFRKVPRARGQAIISTTYGYFMFGASIYEILFFFEIRTAKNATLRPWCDHVLR